MPLTAPASQEAAAAVDKFSFEVIIEARCKGCRKKLATEVVAANIVCPRCGVYNAFRAPRAPIACNP